MGKTVEVSEEIAEEMHRLHGIINGYELDILQLSQWINQLEDAWLQLKRGQLIDGGMKIKQAHIHCRAQLASAKATHLNGKSTQKVTTDILGNER